MIELLLLGCLTIVVILGLIAIVYSVSIYKEQVKFEKFLDSYFKKL